MNALYAAPVRRPQIPGLFHKTVRLKFRVEAAGLYLHPNPGERVRDVHFCDETLALDLADGRTIIVPVVW